MDVRWPLVPFGHRDEATLGIGWRTRRRVEAAHPWFVGGDRFGHLVEDGEDGLFGLVDPLVSLLVSFLEDGEGVQDVVGVVTRDAVEEEERGVELGTDSCATGFVPAEWGTGISEVSCEAGEVVGGVGEFEDPRGDPVCCVLSMIPPTCFIKRLLGRHCKLAEIAECHINSTHLLPCDIVTTK